MSEHTPTPWTAEARGMNSATWEVAKPTFQQFEIVGACGHVIADLRWNGKNEVRGEANAAFIVLACNSHDDLVNALEGLLLFNEELCADVGVSKHYPSAEKARATLARACGEQP